MELESYLEEKSMAFWNDFIANSQKGIEDIFFSNVFIIGPGKTPYFNGIEEFIEAFHKTFHDELDIDKFEVKDADSKALKIDDSTVVVSGTFTVNCLSHDLNRQYKLVWRYSMLYLKDGDDYKIKHMHLSTPLFEEETGLYYVNGEFSKVKNTIVELTRKAEYDLMTQVYNHASFNKHAIEMRKKTDDCTLWMFDFDHFKQFNDTRGHLVGDRLLVVFTDCLKKVFPSTSLFGRLGGDEFVVLVLKKMDSSVCQQYWQELCDTFASSWIDEKDSDEKPTFSSGVAYYCDYDTYEECLTKVDEGLYNAKETRNSMCIIKK